MTTGSHPLSAFTRNFLREHEEHRAHHLQTLTPEQRATVLDEWTEHADFRLMDLLHPDMPEGIMFEAERVLNGHTRKGIPSKRRRFYVTLNPAWEPGEGVPEGFKPRLEVGMRRGERVFQSIIGPTELESDRALTALQKYGPTGKHSHVRGSLVEIDEAEYLEHRAMLRQREAAELQANIDQAEASSGKTRSKGR